MKRFAIAILILATASPALAISRYNSLSMTCDAARQAIRSQGAVILRYPSERVKNMTLYDRYVRNSDFCDANEFADRAVVRTRDAQSCPVLVCAPMNKLDGLLFVPRNSL